MPEWLDDEIAARAESLSLDVPDDGDWVELEDAYEVSEEQLGDTLMSWLLEEFEEDDAEELYDDLMDEEEGNAPFVVYHTLSGSGIFMGDGRWDSYLTARQLTALEKTLKEALSDFVDDTGGGALNEEIEAVLYEGEDEDEDE